jgi:hypothetical protein
MKLTGYRKLVVETLAADGLLSPEQAQEIERVLGERVVRLDSLLVGSGYVAKETLMGVLSRIYGLPWLDPRKLPANELASACREFKIWNYELRGASGKGSDRPSKDEEISMHYRVLPIRRHGATLAVAIPAPFHSDLIDSLKFMTGYNIEAEMAFSDDLLWAMKEFRQMSFEDPWFDEINHAVRTDIHKARFEDRWGFVRDDGAMAIEPRFEEVRDFGKELTAMVREGGKWGLIDRSGAYVSDALFDEVSIYDYGVLTAVRIGDKWGYKEQSGAVRIEPRFDGAEPFVNGLAAVKVNNKWGFIRLDGSFAIEPQFDEVQNFDYPETTEVKLGRKWGIIDRKGKFILEPKYDGISRNTNGWGTVNDGGKCGFLKDDRIVCEPRFDDILSIGESFTGVKSGNKWGFIDRETSVVIEPRYKIVGIFNDGIAPFWAEHGGWGFVDRSGREIVGPIYDKVQSFSEGFAAVKRDGLWGYIDKTGSEVIKPQFDEADLFEAGRARVRTGNRWGFIDMTGALIREPQFSGEVERPGEETIELRFDDHLGFQKHMAAVKVGSLWGYIDESGAMVIEPRFDEAENFEGDLSLCTAKVRKDGKLQYIDRTGKVIYDDARIGFADLVAVKVGGLWGYILHKYRVLAIEPRFEEVRDFGYGDNVAAVRLGGLWGYIDTSGKMIAEPRFEEVRNFSDGVAAVRVGGLWGYIDMSCKVIIEPQFNEAYDFSNGEAWTSDANRWRKIGKTGKIIKEFSEGNLVIEGGRSMGYYVELDFAGRLDATEQFGMFLIIQAPTGVTYQHQCGGLRCDHREAEGFLVPVGGHKDAQPFIDFFDKEFDDYPLVIPWTEAQIKKLRFLVRTMPYYDEAYEEEGTGFGPYNAELDESRMAECTEAWIPVTTSDGNAILIFENCD